MPRANMAVSGLSTLHMTGEDEHGKGCGPPLNEKRSTKGNTPLN